MNKNNFSIENRRKVKRHSWFNLYNLVTTLFIVLYSIMLICAGLIPVLLVILLLKFIF